jgi:hypothetical protein
MWDSGDDFLEFITSSEWRMERTISDYKTGCRGFFKGVTRFHKRSPTIWVYKEQGLLEFGGSSYRSVRCYLYKRREPFVDVAFECGRPFFSMDVRKLPQVEYAHECGVDHYLGKLFVFRPGWQTEWRIIGSRKNIEIFTAYRAIGRPESCF